MGQFLIPACTVSLWRRSGRSGCFLMRVVNLQGIVNVNTVYFVKQNDNNSLILAAQYHRLCVAYKRLFIGGL